MLSGADHVQVALPCAAGVCSCEALANAGVRLVKDPGGGQCHLVKVFTKEHPSTPQK